MESEANHMFNPYAHILINKNHIREIHEEVQNARLAEAHSPSKIKAFGANLLHYIKHRLNTVTSMLKRYDGEESSEKPTSSVSSSDTRLLG